MSLFKDFQGCEQSQGLNLSIVNFKDLIIIDGVEWTDRGIGIAKYGLVHFSWGREDAIDDVNNDGFSWQKWIVSINAILIDQMFIYQIFIKTFVKFDMKLNI